LKNTSTKHNKYVVNKKLEHFNDISFRELFGRIRVVFFNNIRYVPSCTMLMAFIVRLQQWSVMLYRHVTHYFPRSLQVARTSTVFMTRTNPWP
jgi:hypothetical protein